MRLLIPLLIAVSLVTGCASDKKIPPPPQGSIIDVTQPAALARPRQLLEQITRRAGVIRKLDAYQTPVDCASVADYYSRAMRAGHWKLISIAPAAPGEFASQWKYMSRTAYLAGAAPDAPGVGCVVMAGVFSHVRSHIPQARK